MEPARRIEGRGEPRHREARAAAGQIALRERDLGDDHGEGERGHREIEARQPQRRQAEQQSAQRAEAAGGEQRQPRIELVAPRENGEGVGADGEQPHVPDRELPAVTHDEIEPGDEDPVDADQRREVELVLIARPPGQRRERHERQQHRHEPCGTHGLPQTGRMEAVPNSPAGFTSSTSMSSPTAMVC